MKSFILSRLKAVVAAVSVPLSALIIAMVEAFLGFPLSAEMHAMITAGLATILVHQTPNIQS